MTREKSGVKDVIDAFYAAYVRRFNAPAKAEAWLGDMQQKGYTKRPRSVPQEQMVLPLISGAKDGALAQKLLTAFGLTRTLAMIDQFFDLSRRGLPPAINSKHDVGALWFAAPRLQVLPVLASERSLDRRTCENTDAVLRAMGKR